MLAPGSTLGPYKVLSLVGAGGMGEVYRARDTRLGRDVALKVLSSRLTATPEVRARFEREARTVSQLSHPHICTLYDVGRQEGLDYLVMELVEGETLARRLERGPLPVREVLALGTQVAEALDKAHGAGVVHRDLKPGNIMLTAGGAKLMDFGLARTAGPDPAALSAESPTMSRPLTAEGTIVGTFQYMAPEQLEGKDADARADIWALGCVLYEIATGRRAFEGDSQASLIAAIMDREPPPVTSLKPISPPALDHLVKRCLTKDPAERWQSARDVALELRWIAEAGSQAGVPVPAATSRRSRRERLAWGLALGALAVAITAAAGLIATRGSRRPSEPAAVRFSVTAPEDGVLVLDYPSAAISPDGQLLAFTVVDPTGTPRLWIRPLDAVSARPLSGTENAESPFWSHDSRFIGFFADKRLRKVPVAGGLPETICDAPNGRGGTWNREGVIVFAPLSTGPLQRVSAAGGEVVTVATPDPARGETALRYPCFLPDGRHFLYESQPRKKEGFDIYLGDLDSKETARVMTADSAPVYAEPGYLLFGQANRLVTQRFDLSRLRPAGEIIPLGDAPPMSVSDGAPLLCPPASGVLVNLAAMYPDTQLAWLDRAGRLTSTIPLPTGRYECPALSPDGRRAAVTKFTAATGGDLWVVDLQREPAVATRLTFDEMVTTGAIWLWSLDGSRIVFGYNPTGPYDIYQVSASGAGRPEPLYQSSVNLKLPMAWSPDERYLIFCQDVEETGWDIWLLPLEGERRPVPYLGSPFNEIIGAVSPDGRWLAYSSDETGTAEIYVRSFPEPGEKHQVTTAGGWGAQWSRDGRELLIWTGNFYTSLYGKILSVEVETSPSFKAGTPRELFTPRLDMAGLAATSDLQRFLAAVPVEKAAPATITVILNWQAGLKR
jgi:Tol biopolymer transport system component